MDAPIIARRETPVHDAPGRWQGMIRRALAAAAFCAVVVLSGAAFVDIITKDAGMTFKAQITASGIAFGAVGASWLFIEWLLMNKTRIAYSTEEAYQPPTEVAPPTEPSPEIDITIHRPDDRGWERFGLPGTPKALHELSIGLLRGQGFTEAAWTGKDRPYTKAEFHQLRGEFLERRLIRARNPKHPAQGFELTHAGLMALEEIANATRKHTPASSAGVLTAPRDTGAGGG